MPARDGTGPVGGGRQTGRGMGFCGGYPAAGYDAPGRANRGPGRGGRGRRGRGMRGGRGRGWQHGYRAASQPRRVRWGGAYAAPFEPPSREQEVEMLKNEAQWLKEQLGAITQRMDELSQE